MQKHRIWIPAVLLGLLITGCSQQAAGQPAAGSESSAMQTESFSSSEQYESPMAADPWEELNISEDFYRVTENFSRLWKHGFSDISPDGTVPKLNRARLCGQHKKAPGAGILSFRRRGVAQAGPLQSLAGCAHDYKSRYSGQSFRLLQRM